jgi:integrase
MARITKPLTNTEVQHAKPRDKIYTLSDGSGLQLRVKPNGSKIWQLDYYRPYTKKRTSLSLGAYPAVSLAEARKQRDVAKALLAKDIDPQEHKKETALHNATAHRNTLENIAAQWLEVKKTKVSNSHAEDSWRSLQLHIFPSLGNLPIHKITAVKAIDILKPVAAKGSLETVKRLCQRLNEIMVYAANTGIVEVNSLAGIRHAFQSPQKQHLPTLKPNQLPDLMKTLSTASIKPTTRSLIEWQLHTMVRPNEAAGTRWEEIDLDNRLWNIPGERMKGKKSHTVPLSPQCIELLEFMRPISSTSEYVFPSDRNRKKHTNAQTANMALKRMGFEKKLVAHGFRALASTTLNEQGFPPDVIESALSHIDKNEVRAAYNRAEYLERRKVMMAWWSEHIEQCAIGNLSLSSGKKQLRSV